MALCSELPRKVLRKIEATDVVEAEEEVKIKLLEILPVETADDGSEKNGRDAKVKGVVIDEEYLVGGRALSVGRVEGVGDIEGGKNATSNELVVEVEYPVEGTGLLLGAVEEGNAEEDTDETMPEEFVLNVEYNVAEMELVPMKLAVNFG
jgi:hypothetical protein